uniref:Cytoplasmic tRNA 2-thiolation protein 1 n=1 Tax=Theileria annulata TaxID=5874 RepID=A0A3B0MSZ9_THEAN
MVKCEYCFEGSAVLRRSFSGLPSCKNCFIESFENDIYEYIVSEKLICDGDSVCIGVSGGKDSSVLAHVLSKIKEKYKMDWNLYLLGVDEGIKGYRDDSLKVVKSIFKDRFGFSMDQVVKLIGKRGNCTVCGSFRRQMLEIGARIFGANVLCTGHNADDMAETVLLNLFRGDLLKLTNSNTTDSINGVGELNGFKEDLDNQIDEKNVNLEIKSKLNQPTNNKLRKIKRVKPLKYSFEKEIVLYARYLSLDYFSTECIYSPEAYRGHMRSFIKNLELINPKIILNIIRSGDNFHSEHTSNGEGPDRNFCQICGIDSINNICKPCKIVQQLHNLEGLNGNNITGDTNEFCDSGTANIVSGVDLESGIEMGKKARKSNYITNNIRKGVKLRYDG